MDGELGAYIRAQIVKTPIMTVSKPWDNGFRQITSSTKPINTADDLKGFKIRVPQAPMLTSLFKALDAGPAPINFNELYSALQTKVVEGQENPLAIIATARLYEVQKSCSLTGHVWDGYWICANPGSWNRLPNDIKVIVAKAFNEVALLERDDLNKLDRSLQAELEKKGVTFTKSNIDSFRDKLRAAGFYQEWRGKVGNEAWTLLEKQVGKLA
jgi:tripartite ATP-independent transporter DctP family solute receptor